MCYASLSLAGQISIGDVWRHGSARRSVTAKDQKNRSQSAFHTWFVNNLAPPPPIFQCHRIRLRYSYHLHYFRFVCVFFRSDWNERTRFKQIVIEYVEHIELCEWCPLPSLLYAYITVLPRTALRSAYAHVIKTRGRPFLLTYLLFTHW